MPVHPFFQNDLSSEIVISRQAFDCSSDNIFIIDPISMRFVYVNETALQIFGYTKEEFLSLGPKDLDAVIPAELIHAGLLSIINSKGRQAVLPATFRRKNQTNFDTEIQLCCFEEDGQTHILVNAAPSGVLKRTYDELTFHTALFKNISDAIIATNEKLSVTIYNHSAEALFGWTSEEAVEKSLPDFLVLPNSGFFKEELTESLSNNGHWNGELLACTKSGEHLRSFVVIEAIKDYNKKVIGTVSVIRNISELKKKDEQLASLLALVNKVNDGIISVDENMFITRWNKGAGIIYGYTEEEVTGLNIFDLLVCENACARQAEIITDLTKNGFWQEDAKHFRKDKTQVFVSVSGSVLHNEEGLVKGYIAAVKDISERKMLEEKLTRLNEDLEKQVRNQTEQIKQILERVSDAVVALDNDLCYTYINRQAEEMLRQPAGYLIGKNVWQEFPGLIGQPFYIACLEAAETKQYCSSVAYDHTLHRWIENHFYPSSTGISIYGRDVTERKNAELALEESELKYRTMVETAHEGIWQVNEIGITTFVNGYIANLLGYTREEIIGKPCIGFVAGESREKALESIRKRKAGLADQQEITILTRAGQPVITLLQSSPLFNNGAYAGSISLLLDITFRKKAEEKIAANEKRFRALIENSSDGIALLSADGTMLYNSPAGEKITGYSVQVMAGTRRDDYFDPDDVQKINNALKDIIENPRQTKNLELRYKLRDGSYKWLECCYSNLLNEPSVHAIIVNYRDISGRKDAERQLQQHDEQLSLIYHNTIHSMWLLKAEAKDQYRYEAVNGAYTALTGIENHQVVSKLCSEIAELGNNEHFREKYNEAVETGQIIKFTRSTQLAIGRRTGEITIVPLKDEEGKVVRLLCVGNDITEQKKAEEGLKQMNMQLRQLASHLQDVREEERANMAREIHDELGQQLTVLKLDISWLSKKLKSKDDLIENKLNNTLGLIDQTINTVRKLSTELRPGMIDELGLAEALKWHSIEFSKRTGVRAVFTSNVSDAKFSPRISIGIFRIFQESLTNITRHANATGVISVMYKTPGTLQLTISDNGVGFDVSKTGERKTLGLLGMQERITMMNGKYEIVSEPGKGTTISIEVPIE